MTVDCCLKSEEIKDEEHGRTINWGTKTINWKSKTQSNCGDEKNEGILLTNLLNCWTVHVWPENFANYVYVLRCFNSHPKKPAPNSCVPYSRRMSAAVELGSDKFHGRMSVNPVLGNCCHRDWFSFYVDFLKEVLLGINSS